MAAHSRLSGDMDAARRRAGHETLSHFALSLRLCVARCQRRLERFDEAEYSFKVLAGARGVRAEEPCTLQQACRVVRLTCGRSRVGPWQMLAACRREAVHA